MPRETKYELTENVSAVLTVRAMTSQIVVKGGYSDEAPLGWALVIGDRMVRRGLTPQITVKEGDDFATITLNGGGIAGIIDECVCEVL